MNDQSTTLADILLDVERIVGAAAALAKFHDGRKSTHIGTAFYIMGQALQGNYEAIAEKSRTTRIEAVLELANASFDSGEYEATTMLCEEILKIDQANAKALELRERADNYRVAISQTKRGEEAFAADDFTSAISFAEHALKRVSDYAPALNLRARTHTAIEIAQLLTDARQAMETKDYDRTIRLCDEIFGLVENHTEAVELYAQAATRASAKLDKAIAKMAAALNVVNHTAAGRAVLAEIALRNDNTSQACQLVYLSLKLDGQNQTATEIAIQLAEQNAQVWTDEDTIRAFGAPELEPATPSEDGQPTKTKASAAGFDELGMNDDA